MASPYSTITELRANVGIATATNIIDATVTNRIAFADQYIENDFGNVIDFSAIVTNPDFIGLLSQYKTAEMCLVYQFGKKRDVETNEDILYWQKQYDKLAEKIRGGKIALEDGAGNSIATGQQTFENTARDGIEPALGTGKWADHQTKEDLEDERPIT